MWLFGIAPYFWVKLFFLLVGIWFSIDLFNRLASKLFNVKRKKAFFAHRVNKQHYKLDWMIRIAFIMLIIVGYFVNTVRHPLEPLVFLEPYVLLFTLLFIAEIITAVMEWKYDPNPNAYLVTLTQLLFVIVLVVVLFITDFLWLFE